MLNQVVLMGRLTRDIELRYAQGSDKAVGRFSLAVERDYKAPNEERATDFINCVAFDRIAEFIEKHFSKGSMIAIVGRIQTGSYTNREGVKVYTTDVIVSTVSFTGEKKADAQQAGTQPAQTTPPPMANPDGFMDIPADMDELPFN